MDNTQKLGKVEKKVGQKRLIKFYVLPFFSVLIFIGVIGFLVIPKVLDIFNALDQISSLSEQAQKKTQTIADLNVLTQGSNLILAQLNVINQTAPTGSTEVVTFRDKITTLCQNNSLSVITQKLSESDINENANSINTLGLSLLEIPFLFEIQGSYQDTLDFIEDLSSIEDFIIVREMEFTSSSLNSAPLTVLKLRVDKYQFSIVNQDILDSQYITVPIDSKINDIVLKYIESKIK